MNELVKEIAVKAKIQMVSEPRLQEFYELIVKELIAKVEVWEADSRNHISFMLKQEFGVKDAR